MSESEKPNPNLEEAKSLLGSVFDLSFTNLITPKIIKWLYIIGIIAAGLFAGGWVLNAMRGSFFAGLLSLVFAPIVFVFYVLSTRVGLEVVLAVFQMAESMKNIERKLK